MWKEALDGVLLKGRLALRFTIVQLQALLGQFTPQRGCLCLPRHPVPFPHILPLSRLTVLDLSPQSLSFLLQLSKLTSVDKRLRLQTAFHNLGQICDCWMYLGFVRHGGRLKSRDSASFRSGGCIHNMCAREGWKCRVAILPESRGCRWCCKRTSRPRWWYSGLLRWVVLLLVAERFAPCSVWAGFAYVSAYTASIEASFTTAPIVC